MSDDDDWPDDDDQDTGCCDDDDAWPDDSAIVIEEVNANANANSTSKADMKHTRTKSDTKMKMNGSSSSSSSSNSTARPALRRHFSYVVLRDNDLITMQRATIATTTELLFISASEAACLLRHYRCVCVCVCVYACMRRCVIMYVRISVVCMENSVCLFYGMCGP